ncbi:lipopolysaccharide biosynthesis protein [Microbacterium sp. STN6]|uniref:lipopolysaccharide biosynthesis protein n=1 Tax=Microbacterium sp. STN6 TaxID=2995588 RepID=UPI002260A501|nr:lipopolysaccharide biosynthesis protein [Microbacterium sp. STN6]MCX7523038.1 lipopolysaccharide biosynthesis protein [Microbacterium sp. STN6]
MVTSLDQTAAGDGLGRRAVRGATVTIVGQVGRVVVQTLSVVVLARLLTPNDYGLFAMVVSVAGIAEVFRDFGLSQAAVQAKTLSTAQRDALFWVNSAIGVALGLIIFFGSWTIAGFFRHPELVPLTQAISVVFVINGVATQFRASLTRSLRFTALVLIDFGSTLAGLGLAIVLGILGFGVWALAFQLIVQSAVVLGAAAAICRWLPGRPRRGVGVRSFLRFGSHMVATQIITYAGNNADTVTIGLAFGAAPLGIYNRPYQLVMNIANQLRAPITNVAIPVLSRLQDAPKRYWEFARVGQLALGYTIVAALSVATGAAGPLTEILLGHKWLESAPVLSLLSASAALQTLGYFGYWVYVSKGITKALFNFNLVSVILKIAFLVVGAFWGVTGVAAGYFLSTLIKWPLSLAWIARAIDGVPIRVFVYGFVRMATLAGLGAGAAFLATLLTEPYGHWLQAIAALCAVLCTYALALLLPAVRRDVADLAAAARMLKREPI